MSINITTSVWSLEGNHQLLDGGAMFGNAPRAVWERWSVPDAKGRIRLSCRSLYIETGDYKVLCETGIGAYMTPDLADRYGVEEREHMLLKNLGRLGLSHEDIDFLILSHLHFDHAGGLLPVYDGQSKAQVALLFPKAQYVVSRQAWDRAYQPHPRDRASFIPGLCEALLASGRLRILDDLKVPELPHLSFRMSHGHTPGHMHTVVKGKKQTVFFAGDLIPGRPWVHVPITMGYDRFAEMVIDEKSELYAKAVPEGWLVFYTHDSEVAASRIAQDDKGRFKPFDEQRELAAFSLD